VHSKKNQQDQHLQWQCQVQKKSTNITGGWKKTQEWSKEKKGAGWVGAHSIYDLNNCPPPPAPGATRIQKRHTKEKKRKKKLKG
jgi:hypothetical protein